MNATAVQPSGVAIVAIGDELLAGKHPDLNSARIAAALLELDLVVTRIAIVGDDLDQLTDLLGELCATHEFVFVSGGLGPTLDDVTRHAIAAAAGVELVLDEAVLAGLRAYFAGLGREMPAGNERQALFPRGATVLVNRAGTAPGFQLRIGDAQLFSLPGPPREMNTVLTEQVLPVLERQARRRGALAKATFHLFGISESAFAAEAGDWMRRPQNPLMGVSADRGVLTVTIRAQGGEEVATRALLAARADEFRDRFARYVFSESDADLALALGVRLLERGISVALAESCTAGLVAARLADVPGISAVFERAYVTYSDRAKIELLGVREATLHEHGAVSAAVVAEMALGAARAAGARLGLGVSGIAGPGGGSAEKPIGLVWIATAFDGAVLTSEHRLPDRGRAEVRRWACERALHALLQRV